MQIRFPDRFRFVFLSLVTSPKTNEGMEAYHIRWYTFLLVLDLFVDAEARLRDDCRNISLSFLFFGVEVSCWLQKDIIIDSISFRKRSQREGRSIDRIIA